MSSYDIHYYLSQSFMLESSRIIAANNLKEEYEYLPPIFLLFECHMHVHQIVK